MRLSFLALLSVGLFSAGCGGRDSSDSSMNRSDLGTGLNTVAKKYAKPAPDVWDAAVGAVKSFDFKVDSDRHDKMGGELVAHRASGDKVEVTVRSIDKENTDVSIRVEPGNRNMANLLHEKIAEKVGMGTSKAGVFGDTSVDGTYVADLRRCATLAETVCKNANLSVTGRELRDSSAVVNAREGNSNPVRIQLDRSGDSLTKVTFSAGDASGSDPKALTSRLKAEFDREISSSGR
ncbi:MAG TPA: DUF3568 family protein [Planctomycetota bacterium]|nr:DUF3568 family protein [Planctomycetota bacterium]